LISRLRRSGWFKGGAQRRPAARKQATKRGLDPNKWFNHVEVLAAEKIGCETVQYVSNIFKYYLAYKMVIEEQGQREKAKEEMKKEMGK